MPSDIQDSPSLALGRTKSYISRMANIAELVRRGGAKGMPRAMKALYDALGASGGFQDHIQTGVAYPNSLFTSGVDQYLAVAPWPGEIVAVAIVNQATITGGQSNVDFNIVGGASNPIATLDTGDNAVGTASFEIIDPPVPISLGGVVLAQSNGNSSGNSTVMVFVVLRSVGTA